MAKHLVNANLRYLHSELKHKRRSELITKFERKEISFEETNKIFVDENIKTGVRLEGSSRSMKTWSSIDFIIYTCTKLETGATINIIKETYNSFKTTLYDDFNRRLPDFGILSPFSDKQEVKSFKLFGNKINLLGADSESLAHGVSCDYLYANEGLDIPKSVWDQATMRCRKFWWMDYNPKFTKHWVYDTMDNNPRVGFLKTTFKDNIFISHAEKSKILSYEPTADNIRNGTADEYKWNVYGLGLRSAPEGLVFQHVKWVDEFPRNIEKVWYGLDFGYTNSPSVLVRVGIAGNELFAEKLFYAPTPSVNELLPVIRAYCKDTDSIWADPSGDSGGRGMISQLRRAGFRVLATNTFPGSIKHGISIMKRYRINLVDSWEVRKEQSGYRYRVIQGIALDEPEDDANHFFDAVRYAVMSNVV